MGCKTRAGQHRHLVQCTSRKVCVVPVQPDGEHYECHWYVCEDCLRVNTRRGFREIACTRVTLPQTIVSHQFHVRRDPIMATV